MPVCMAAYMYVCVYSCGYVCLHVPMSDCVALYVLEYVFMLHVCMDVYLGMPAGPAVSQSANEPVS